MARSRGPANLVAQRSSQAERADGVARHSYDDMIAQDLGGRRATSYRAVDEGRPASAAELLLRPLTLFLLACLAFVCVLLAWLWQIGALAAPSFSLTPPRPVESSDWMGARRAPVAAAPQKSVVEAPVADPAENTSDDDIEGD